jgi:hypothetical protein
MGFTWYFLGLLTTGSGIFLWHFSKRYQLNWLSWSGLTLGIVLILFSIAWAVGSVLEGVPRAASMGLLLFGLSGIVILTLAFRYTSTKRPKIPQTAVEHALPKEVEIETPSEKKAPARKSIIAPYISVVVRYGAYASLIIALILGLASEGRDYESMVRSKFKDQKLTKVNDNPVVFQLGEKGNGPGNYVLIQEGHGYGGPFVLSTRLCRWTTKKLRLLSKKSRMPDTGINSSARMSAVTLLWGWILMRFPEPQSPPWPLHKPYATVLTWLPSKSSSSNPNGKKCPGILGWMKS